MRKEEKPRIQNPLNIALGTLTAFMITILLLTLAAFGVSMGILSEGHIPQITILISVVGVFTGAFLTNTTRKMRHGVLVGVCFALLLVAVKILFYGNNEITADTITMILIALCAGTLSGFASKGKQKGRDRKKKHGR